MLKVDKRLRVYPLIGQAFVARSDVDDAAIGETVLHEVVLHDGVVAMSVDADIGVVGETEIHDGGEDAVDIRIAGDAVDDMVGLYIVKPRAAVDLVIGRIWRREEGEIGYYPALLLDDEATV